MAEIRMRFHDELTKKLNKLGIKAIIKHDKPANGAVVKLNGVALYKVLTVPNPFKTQGIAIYRKLTDKAITKVGGKRANGKNDWVGAPLTQENYATVMKILLSVAEAANRKRNQEMEKAAKIKKKGDKK